MLGAGSISEENIHSILGVMRVEMNEDDFGRIYAILLQNLKSGRIHRVVKQKPDQTIDTYIHRVCQLYFLEHSNVNSLVVKRSPLHWQQLHHQLFLYALKFLLRAGLPEAIATASAEDYAQEASIVILSTPYTYDIPFTAWAMRITKNICCNHARQKKNERIDRSKDPTSIADDIAYGCQPSIESQVLHSVTIQEEEALLYAAIEELPCESQSIINSIYWEGKKQQDVARELKQANSTISRKKVKAHRIIQQKMEGFGYNTLDENSPRTSPPIHSKRSSRATRN